MADRTTAEVREWAQKRLDGLEAVDERWYAGDYDCGDYQGRHVGSSHPREHGTVTGECWADWDALRLMADAPDMARELLRLADLAEAQSAELERLRGLAELIGPMPEDTSFTAHPYWLIIDPRQMMRPDCYTVASMISGPFLSREDADAHLAGRRHAFSDRAVVYAHSGHHSAKWRHICELRSMMRLEAMEAADAATEATDE